MADKHGAGIVSVVLRAYVEWQESVSAQLLTA